MYLVPERREYVHGDGDVDECFIKVLVADG